MALPTLKDPDDTRSYSRDWTDDLNGESITNVTWTVPSGLTQEAVDQTGNVTTIFVSGGTAGVDYTVLVKVTTDNATQARVLEKAIVVRVRSAPNLVPGGFTTVLAVASELEVDDDDSLDLIGELIGQATDFIKSYCRREFETMRKTEEVAGFDSVNLLLNRMPITAVHSVLCDSEPVTDFKRIEENDKAGILFRSRGWLDSSQFVQGLTPTRHPYNRKPIYAVDYTAGYVLPGLENRDFPYDLERACTDIVKHFFLRKSRDLDVRFEKIDQIYSRSYRGDSEFAESGIPPAITVVLDRYRREA